MNDRIDPVVVHGQGRNGTTVLLRMLGAHPDLAWFSQYQGRWPGHASVAALSRAADVDVARDRFKSTRWFPQPAEAIQAWERHFPGFHANAVDWPGDVPEGAAAAFWDEIEATRRWQGKPGFLTKYTGYPRYEFVRSVIPNVRIVHIDRDPRAVVMSMVKQRWGYKRKPEVWATMSGIERIDQAADRMVSWATEMDVYKPDADYLSYRYEELVADPRGVLGRMLEDLGLRFCRTFESRVRRFEILDPAETWRTKVTPAELAHLEDRLATTMQARGYA